MNTLNSKSVLCMGEMLVDMIQESSYQKTYTAFPGGAPANVAVGIARLGGNSAFMGKVGQDTLGDFLEDVLSQEKVDTKALCRSGKTAIALVSLDKNGERSFEFYGDLTTFEESDINAEAFNNVGIFHFGSNSLINENSKLATMKCITHAKTKNISISYDPNLRLNLWGKPEMAKERITTGLLSTDILKVSDEELEFLTGEQNIEKGKDKLLNLAPNLKLITITLGPKGCYCYFDGLSKAVSTIEVDVKDTTGAGDGFMAGLLYSIMRFGGLKNITWAQLEESLNLANMVGSLTTTKKGAITALPSMNDITESKSRLQSK